jgi:drug/metabolite transporter (DMT)-like permease
MAVPMTRSDRWKYAIGSVIAFVIVRLLFELIDPPWRSTLATLMVSLISLGVLLYKGSLLKTSQKFLCIGVFLSFGFLAILFYLELRLPFYQVAAIMVIPVLVFQVLEWREKKSERA